MRNVGLTVEIKYFQSHSPALDWASVTQQEHESLRKWEISTYTQLARLARGLMRALARNAGVVLRASAF